MVPGASTGRYCTPMLLKMGREKLTSCVHLGVTACPHAGVEHLSTTCSLDAVFLGLYELKLGRSVVDWNAVNPAFP